MDYTNTYPGREIILQDKSYLYFGGTSYLGIQANSHFQQIYSTNIKKYGTNYGASRRSNIQLSIFDEAETYLSEKATSEAAITLSSGYLTGQLIAQYFDTANYKTFYAPRTHSALSTNTTVHFKSYDQLNQALRLHLKSDSSTEALVILDTIDFFGGNFPDYSELKKLPLDKIILVADDSHGIGIIGNNGLGSYCALQQLHPKELIICGSLGKSYGIQAGVIFGSKTRINAFKDTSLFGGASPASPAGLATLIASENLYLNQRILLLQNISYFLAKLKNPKVLKSIRDFPSFMYKDPAFTAYLRTHYILLTHFNYPNTNAPLISKIVISAYHTQEDLDKLAFYANKYFS